MITGTGSKWGLFPETQGCQQKSQGIYGCNWVAGGTSQENHHRKWPPAGQSSEPSLEGKVWGFLFRFQGGKLQPFCMEPVSCPASVAMARHPSPLPKSKGKSLDGTEYRTVAVGKSPLLDGLLDGLKFSHSKMDPSRDLQ